MLGLLGWNKSGACRNQKLNISKMLTLIESENRVNMLQLWLRCRRPYRLLCLDKEVSLLVEKTPVTDLKA